MTIIQKEIQPLIEKFTEDLTALVRRAALDAVETAIGGGVASLGKPLARRGPSPAKDIAAPTPKAGGKTAAPSKAPAKKTAAPARASGQKRPPEELAKLTEKLGAYIKTHPGLRMENIAKGMGVPTVELNLPVKKLLAAKTIRTKGQKRATEYFPA